jgi:cell wall-associated NlpC family hydrolase
MFILQRVLLLFSLFLLFTFLVVVSNAEAARTKGKKTQTSLAKKKVSVKKKQTSRKNSQADFRPRPVQLEAEYLAAELTPHDSAVLQKALGLLGIRYRFGGNSYDGIDCSAFVKKVYGSLDLTLPRTAREQYSLGVEVPTEKLQEGDLLFFRTYATFPSHVGIYIGNDLMIHASSEGGRVMVSKMNTPFFQSRFIGARRIASEGEEFALIQDGV